MHDYMGTWDAFVDRLKHLVLPVASLTLLTMAGIARYQRAAMLEVLPADFIRTARAKGLPEREVIWRHALRTALTPMVTLLGLMLPGACSAARCSSRRCSHGPAWACSPRTRSAPATTTS